MTTEWADTEFWWWYYAPSFRIIPLLLSSRNMTGFLALTNIFGCLDGSSRNWQQYWWKSFLHDFSTDLWWIISSLVFWSKCEAHQTKTSEWRSLPWLAVALSFRGSKMRGTCRSSAPPGCSGVRISWGAFTNVCPVGRVWKSIMCRHGHWQCTQHGK